MKNFCKKVKKNLQSCFFVVPLHWSSFTYYPRGGRDKPQQPRLQRVTATAIITNRGTERPDTPTPTEIVTKDNKRQ